MLRLSLVLAALWAAAGVAEEPKKKKYVKDMADTDFTKRDLTGKDFADYNLENCKFYFTQMKEMNLRGANLSGADFDRASLGKADLSGCDLRNAKFTWASAQYANFEKADLRGVDLSLCTVQKSNFKDADLRNVKGIKDLTGANFTGADLRGANMQDAIDYSNSAIFKGAKYDKATRWPRGFDVEASGAVLVKPEEKKE